VSEPELVKRRIRNHLQKGVNPKVEDIRALMDHIEELENELVEANRNSKSKSEYLANATHELRSPLNTIMGTMKLILDDLTESREEELKFIQNAYTTSEHLLGIINDLLDLSKLEAGLLIMEVDEVDLSHLFLDVKVLTGQMAKQKGLELNIDTDEAPHMPLVLADYHRTKQVLYNLIYNSIKFTPSGSITVTAEVNDTKDLAKVVVTDTGRGIETDKLEIIFEPFIQAETSISKKYGGSGLGLTISRELIEAMGGEMGIESEGIGKGAAAWFTLPLVLELKEVVEQ